MVGGGSIKFYHAFAVTVFDVKRNGHHHTKLTITYRIIALKKEMIVGVIGKWIHVLVSIVLTSNCILAVIQGDRHLAIERGKSVAILVLNMT
jgi:hypothetical protein